MQRITQVRRAVMKSAMKPVSVVVFDLESTGPDYRLDDIIEVAAVGVDDDFNELFRFESLVQPSIGRGGGWNRMMNHPVVLKMHQDSGLFDELSARMGEDYFDLPTVYEVSRQLAEVITLHTGDVKPLLGGSGVSHFDSRFIETYMPEVQSTLRDSLTLDVGVMRRAYRMATGHNLSDVNTRKTHRAMDDVECHITELRDFHALFKQDYEATSVSLL